MCHCQKTHLLNNVSAKQVIVDIFDILLRFHQIHIEAVLYIYFHLLVYNICEVL